MIFGPAEIFLCLAAMMAIILTIGLSLLAQNLSIDHKRRWKGQMPCPQCAKRLNAEAYICRYCDTELKEPLWLQ